MTTATDAALPERVLATIRRHALLHGGDVVLVAVSGGADSVALLDVLAGLRDPLHLVLHAVHVHHGLRLEADADALHVSALCRDWRVPLQVERVRVAGGAGDPAAMGARWAGLEAEARRARYATFRRAAAAVGADRVATGHSADDQAETVLMRLLDGAGPRGLAGIPIARGPYIRPLLETRRAEIEAHLRGRGIAWVEDLSNRDPALLRNRIRRDLLPFLAARFTPDPVAALCRSARLARALVGDLERHAAERLAALARRGPAGLVLSADALAALPRELAAEVLRQALLAAGGSGQLRAPAQLGLRRLLRGRPGRLVVGTLAVERSGRLLRVGPARLPALETRRVPVPGSVALDEI
ncbi:MAG: tRNA lysidine(34) synthetase TilS, partial [Candidatus Rokubacteria bacterium]|nr:tRNA lysidine(34) synthetase TilS [Candidatus Rokubacteria bacterium]